VFDVVDAHMIIAWNQRYEVSRDGKRFLMVKDRQNEDSPPGMVLGYGWLTEAQVR
jgi:hypothetical protein